MLVGFKGSGFRVYMASVQGFGVFQSTTEEAFGYEAACRDGPG